MLKNSIMIAAACLLYSAAQAQQPLAERFDLPRYDCEQKAIMDAKKITMVVPDDSTVVWSFAQETQKNGARRGGEVIIKTESQLQKSDFDDTLWIMGPIASYSRWDRFGIPVKKLSHGFEIGNFSFKDPSYGFTYVTSPESTLPFRLVISGNSLEAYEKTANMPSFGFEYIVVKNAVPELIGNGSQIVDLNELRDSLYKQVESKYYVFMVSKNLDMEGNIEKYDNHVEAFIKKMELSLPTKKIKTYIHDTQEEIKYFSGFFNALCDGGTLFGFVTGDEIHSFKWADSIEHEANHHLFNEQVNETAPTFLSEGIQKWYEYTVRADIKKNGFQKALEFIDEDLTDAICGVTYFFQEDKYYLISGIFTDYLIDVYGLNKFKELYGYNTRDVLSGFEKTYNKSLSEILEEYKIWLLSKSIEYDITGKQAE